MYKCNIVLEETHVFQNTPCDVSLQRPFNGFGENNALPLRKMHQEEKKKKHRGGHWTLSEDLKLKELVAVFGPQNWKFIGEKMEPRTSKILFFFSFVLTLFLDMKVESFFLVFLCV